MVFVQLFFFFFWSFVIAHAQVSHVQVACACAMITVYLNKVAHARVTRKKNVHDHFGGFSIRRIILEVFRYVGPFLINFSKFNTMKTAINYN